VTAVDMIGNHSRVALVDVALGGKLLTDLSWLRSTAWINWRNSTMQSLKNRDFYVQELSPSDNIYRPTPKYISQFLYVYIMSSPSTKLFIIGIVDIVAPYYFLYHMHLFLPMT